MKITVETLFDLSPALLRITSCAKKVRIYICEPYRVLSPKLPEVGNVGTIYCFVVIGPSKGYFRRAPPRGKNILSFSCSLRQKICKIIN